MTEESDGILDLVDSCLEVRGDLVVAEQFFRDDAVLLPSFPGSPSPRTNYTRVTFDLAERLRVHFGT